MSQPIILLTVRPGRGGLVRVEVTRPESWRYEADIRLVGGPEFEANQLADAMESDQDFVPHLHNLLDEHPYAEIYVDVREPGLQRANWEALPRTRQLERTQNALFRKVIRYSPELADLALVPLEMPLDVLVGSLSLEPYRARDELAHPLAHFRTVWADRLDAVRGAALLASARYDIVHLAPVIIRRDGIGSVSRPHREGPNWLDANTLRRLLITRKKAATRLIILDTQPEDISEARALAYRLAGRNGPTVVVAVAGVTGLREFYYSITHDGVLDLNAAGYEAGMVLVAAGGSEALSLTRAESALRARLAGEKQRLEAALRGVTQPSTGGYLALDPADANLKAAINEVGTAAERVFSYDRESGGMEPMSEATRQLDEALARAEGHVDATRRVVNICFERSLRQLARQSSLAADTVYRLAVQIGAPSRASIVESPVAIPEEDLKPHYAMDGFVELRVVVYSTDFKVDERSKKLRLPRPPRSSRPLHFDVRTPERIGDAWLRVAVYHENNLLQSVLITAAVTVDEVARHRVGNRGEVEWLLSTSLADVTRFGSKTVSFLANETPHSTHLLAIAGSDFEHEFELDPTEITTKTAEARLNLQWICGNPEKGEEYRYAPHNRGDAIGFRSLIAHLAKLGWNLYTDLVTGEDLGFRTELDELLSLPATIQIARMRSAKSIFPWALVYDHPIVLADTNQVCPDFLAVVAGGANSDDLANHACFAAGCANRADTNVVCPSGFWGFRHVIEQPLSRSKGRSATDAPTEVVASGSIQTLVGYSEALSQVQDHLGEVTALGDLTVESSSDLLEIGTGLQRINLHLVYFYCHGGRKRSDIWLGIGGNPEARLTPADLLAWNVQWPNPNPMVFLNGCETAGVNADDILAFTEQFAYSRASGLMGTEITIPETLGRHFGNLFLTGFAGGEQIGSLVRSLRLGLLACFNPLGLAYTPHALAKLRIVRS